nr:DUF3520 domain-containing protein [Bacteroidota bacterium]
YENRILNKEDFNDDKKDAGDIGSGHTVTALYEIVLAGSNEDFTNVDPLEYQQVKLLGGTNLMTVKLRYKEPADSVSKLIIHRVKERDITRLMASNNLIFASAVAEFGMLLRDSELKGNASYDHTLAMAKEGTGKDPFGYRRDFIRLVEVAQLLSK